MPKDLYFCVDTRLSMMWVEVVKIYLICVSSWEICPEPEKWRQRIRVADSTFGTKVLVGLYEEAL